MRELYRRSGGGGADITGYQLTLALEQLTEAGYLENDGVEYITSKKQPERLYNADEFLEFANASGISVLFSCLTGTFMLAGANEEAKGRLQYMLEYSRSLGIPDTLKSTLIDRLNGCKTFYDTP